jgi:hypothetical protein
MPASSSGFLGSYAALQQGTDGASASLGASMAIDPARVSIEEIEWPGDAGRTLSVEERRLLASQLRQALLVAVQALPPSSEARPAVLRAAITHVDTVLPLLNAGSTLLLFVPLDAGGAAVEIEAVDPGTRTQLAALTTRYEPPLSALTARFSRLEPARIALCKAAADFGALLRPAVQEAGAGAD